jgi:F-type H+-transporting ATPase subunit delta
MAELATIARPYAEALFGAAGADALTLKPQLDGAAELAASPELRQFADSPKVEAAQVYDLMAGAAQSQQLGFDPRIANLLRAVIDNGRLAALPEIATQYQALLNEHSGVADATVYSAFPIEGGQLAEVVAALEKRFARKLNAAVEIDPELIGGIRAVVGDEVLDASVKARLAQMKAALIA